MTKILHAWLRLTAGLILLASIDGCSHADRVVYLGNASTKTVRLRETLKNVKCWYKDSSGVATAGQIDLLEGGYYRNDLQD